ncbi:MAG: Hsp20/alpha crystallin family protein [Legionella sp.]|nr:Hsp20/alpha crystallin family protein [Legionella sp.]
MNANPFLKLQHEVNHAMSDFYNLFQPLSANMDTFEHMMLTPALDVVEDAKSFKIEAEMPGMSEEDISIHFINNRLIIEGEKSTSKKDNNKNFVNREISYGHYERSIGLPETANVDKATASFKKGMLWIVIPKKAAIKSSKKNIKIEKAK